MIQPKTRLNYRRRQRSIITRDALGSTGKTVRDDEAKRRRPCSGGVKHNRERPRGKREKGWFVGTHPVYGYSVRAVRGDQVVNRATVEGPRRTPQNLHYLRLQRSPLCRKWGSLCAPFFFFLLLLLLLSSLFLRVPWIGSILRAAYLSERPSTEGGCRKERREGRTRETLAGRSSSFLRFA